MEVKTLTSLWVDDGGQQGSPAKGLSTPSTPSSSSQLPDDILKFYHDQGFDTMAKEAGIIETAEELVMSTSSVSVSAPQQQQPQQQQQSLQQPQQLQLQQQQPLQQQPRQLQLLQPPQHSKTIKLIAVPVSSTLRHPFKVIPRTVFVSGAMPISFSSQSQPSIVVAQTTLVSLPQRTVALQQQQQQLLPKVIQLVTTPAHSSSSNIVLHAPQQHQVLQQQQLKLQQQQQQGLQQDRLAWTVNKRPSVIPPPTPEYSVPAPARALHVGDSGDYDSKRRKGAHGGKGLRHFSMKVCEKVQRKGVTSYNEVADELVNEFSDPSVACDLLMIDQQFDQKNIRRRVYDALNVLMAMNIISKEKKEIRWIGLPTNSAQECQTLELEKQRLLDRIQQKTQQLNELILQQIAFKNLVQRNRAEEEQGGRPGGAGGGDGSAIQLPFILVNTNKKTVIDCSISSDRYEYLFNFDETFEIHDDIEVLKRMGLAFGLERGDCSLADLSQAVRMVPKALESYVVNMAGASAGKSTYPKPLIVKIEPGLQSSTAARCDAFDAEVAMTTTRGTQPLLSRQSSFGSTSDPHSTLRDSPLEDDFSGADCSDGGGSEEDMDE